MNRKTKFELNQCLTELRQSYELLNNFSNSINKSIESLEEAVFSSTNDPTVDFTKTLNDYETLIKSYRILKNNMFTLSKTVLSLNGYDCDVANR